MHATLLIPHLLWPEAEHSGQPETPACPALSALLARSRASHCATQSLEEALCRCFGHEVSSALGAFRLLGEMGSETENATARWLCADPAHLRFHQERLILADAQQLAIQPEEARQLLAALNAELPEIGRFYAATPERWYLQLANPDLSTLTAPPLATVAACGVDEILPEILEDRQWRRQFTAIQTVLHAHPLNRQRDDAGRLTINSLWLWGDGHLPERQESVFDGLWSTHPLARGLARAAGVARHPLPLDAAQFLAHAARGTQQLVVLEDLMSPVQYENTEAWHEALLSLENRWFAPLKRALATGKIKQLHLQAPCLHAALAWDCRPADRWKFWKKPCSVRNP